MTDTTDEMVEAGLAAWVASSFQDGRKYNPDDQFSGFLRVSMRAALEAAASLRPSVWMDISTAPKGWKLVPEVPTPEMVEALERCESYCESCKGTAFSGWSGYDAMLSAAPTPPKAPTP